MFRWQKPPCIMAKPQSHDSAAGHHNGLTVVESKLGGGHPTEVLRSRSPAHTQSWKMIKVLLPKRRCRASCLQSQHLLTGMDLLNCSNLVWRPSSRVAQARCGPCTRPHGRGCLASMTYKCSYELSISANLWQHCNGCSVKWPCFLLSMLTAMMPTVAMMGLVDYHHAVC